MSTDRHQSFPSIQTGNRNDQLLQMTGAPEHPPIALPPCPSRLNGPAD